MMQRLSKHKGNVTAILTADWHLREDTPVCRTDDFWLKQIYKLGFVKGVQAKYQCSVLNAGDLFHSWKASPYLLTTMIESLPKEFYTVYGNHDLPQHAMSLLHKSSVYTLSVAEALYCPTEEYNISYDTTVVPISFGQELKTEIFSDKKRKVLLWHQFVYDKEPPYPGAPNPAKSILKKYPMYDLIVTGDNHQAFVVQHEGRLLVNPGSLTRQTADQADFKPRVYLWYAESNTVEAVYLPIEEGVVTREHIDVITRRNDRIDAFISKLNTDYKAGVNFEANLKEFIQANNTPKTVTEVIYKSLEDGS